jgi:hypothetical protein
MEAYNEKYAAQQMKTLITAVWEVWFEPIWVTRNFILHKTPNTYNQLMVSNNEEKQQWYHESCHKLLAFMDRYFADHSDEEIQAMTHKHKTKHEWAKQLNSTREYYQEELKHIQSGQRVITEYSFYEYQPTNDTTDTLRDDKRDVRRRPSDRKKRVATKQPVKILKQQTLFDSTQPFRCSKRIIDREIIHNTHIHNLTSCTQQNFPLPSGLRGPRQGVAIWVKGRCAPRYPSLGAPRCSLKFLTLLRLLKFIPELINVGSRL